MHDADLAAAPQPAENLDDLELAAFRSAGERLRDIGQQVETLHDEIARHILLLEAGTRYRNRHKQERFVADMIGEIWGELASVRLLMREG